MITLGTGKRTKEGDEKRDVVDSGKNRSEGGTGNFKRSTLGVGVCGSHIPATTTSLIEKEGEPIHPPPLERQE